MFKDSLPTDQFVKLDQLEIETVLQDINPVLPGSSFNAETATVMASALSFYPGYSLIDIADYETTPTVRKFLVYKPGEAVLLNWTNEPIYALNERAPVVINESTVTEYVRFFFTYVRGKHGRFIIAESVDDIAWREEPPPAARKAIGKLIDSVKIKGSEADGSFRIGVCMMFKDSLFRSDVHIKPGGLVSLTREELLIEDMPVLDDTFGQ